MQASFKVNDSEFKAAVRQVLTVTPKTFPDLLNTKGYYISRRALWGTHKADRAKMAAELGEAKLVSISTRGKTKGKFKRGGKSVFASTLIRGLAAKSLKSKNEEITSDSLEKKMRQIASARFRSIAFIKSGFLEPIRVFGQHVKDRFSVPPMDRDSKSIGPTKKGGAIIAKPGWKSIAILWNSARTKRAKNDPLSKYAGPALQRAFNDEAKSMREYYSRKLQQIFNSVNAR